MVSFPRFSLQQGYSTYAIGKWHLTPAHQMSAAGPYDRWPLGAALSASMAFWAATPTNIIPELVYDNHQVEPEKTLKRAIT